jgi:hypothetical protein
VPGSARRAGPSPKAEALQFDAKMLASLTLKKMRRNDALVFGRRAPGPALRSFDAEPACEPPLPSEPVPLSLCRHRRKK